SDELGYLGFNEYSSSNDFERGTGNRRRYGDHDDFSNVRVDQWLDNPHRYSPGIGLDCRDTGKPLDYQGWHAAVRCHRNLWRQQHAKPDQFGDLEFDQHSSGDDFEE